MARMKMAVGLLRTADNTPESASRSDLRLAKRFPKCESYPVDRRSGIFDIVLSS